MGFQILSYGMGELSCEFEEVSFLGIYIVAIFFLPMTVMLRTEYSKVNFMLTIKGSLD